MDMDRIERIEKKIKGSFDSYELFFLKENEKKFETRNMELSAAEVKEEVGVALRAVRDGRMVFSYSFDDEEEAAHALLANATAILPFLEVDRNAGFPEPSGSYEDPAIYDRSGLSTGEQEKAAILMDMERTILEYDPRIRTTRNCELQETEIHAAIVNSRGVRVEAKKTIYALSAMCVAQDEDEVSWFDWSWGNRLLDLDGPGLGRDIARTAVSLLSSRQLDTGVYNGILTAQASCDLLGVLAGSFLAENLYKKKTRLADKAGTRCFSELLSITDSGLAGIDTFPFDGEGVASQINRVVRNGYFETFLYDGYYGRKLGKPSTANASRSGIKEPPSCAPQGLFIEKGRKDLDREALDGVVIAELMGTHTANPITGDFSLGATGYLQKNGSTMPFSGVILSGNLFEVLNSVIGVGRDLKFYGTHGSPSLYVEGLKISGK